MCLNMTSGQEHRRSCENTLESMAILTVHKVRWGHLNSTWGNYGRPLILHQLCGWFCCLLSISCLVEDARRYAERTGPAKQCSEAEVRNRHKLPYLALWKKRQDGIKLLFVLLHGMLQIIVNCTAIQACYLINQLILIVELFDCLQHSLCTLFGREQRVVLWREFNPLRFDSGLSSNCQQGSACNHDIFPPFYSIK